MRYILIDYMHLAHRCIVAEPLSTTVMINNELQVIDTTIPNYTIKNIFNYSGRGLFHTGVFFEGGSDYRKKHFAKTVVVMEQVIKVIEVSKRVAFIQVSIWLFS